MGDKKLKFRQDFFLAVSVLSEVAAVVLLLNLVLGRSEGFRGLVSAHPIVDVG
jgi:hypothetical protein